MEKKTINKYNSISYLNFPISVNKKNRYIYNNLKKDEEEKNYGTILSSSIKNQSIDKNIKTSNNKTNNYFSSNIDQSIKDENGSSTNRNISQKGNPEFERNMSEIDEMISNDLILDEINLKNDYEKIEKEISKYKNNNAYDNNNEKANDSKLMDIKDNINKNEDYNLDNKNALINTFYSNSISEGDLFYYSDDEEDLNKKIKTNNEKIKKMQENINKLGQDNIENIDINNVDKMIIKNMGINNKIIGQNKNSTLKKEQKNELDEKFLENIEYGIDETGNPIDVKIYKEEISQNKNNKTKKIIAYIILSNEKGKNHLIDLKGNIIPKREDGDFHYKYNGIHIIIRNFDVQNPKLRVFGARKRYSSVFDDDIVPKESKRENPTSPGDKKIMLFDQIKNKIYYKNKNIFKNSRLSPILNRNNYREKILNININKKTREKPINIGLNKYKKIKENKIISHYNKNTKNFIYRKTPLEKMKELDVINLSQKVERKVDSVKRTNIILNTSEIRNSQNNRINSNFINIFMKNKGYDNFTWRNNRTPSPLKKEMISVPKELNDKEKVVQHKIYKLKKERESYNNYNNVLNLSSANTNISNNPLIKINKNSHLLKNSNSSFIKNNSSSKKINPMLKKSQSINNNISETINSISNNIKRIEYNIINNIQKHNKNFLNKNSELHSITNSKGNLLNGNYYNYNSYNIKIGIMNKSNIIHNNENEENELNIKKMALNKKSQITTSPNRSFKCSVLSKEANEVIADYSNSRKNIKRKIIQKINIQEDSKINENKHKNRTILIKDKIIKYDFSRRSLNNSYDSNQIGKKKCVFKIKNKNVVENNKNNDIVEYQRNVLLNKMIKNSKLNRKFENVQIYKNSNNYFNKDIKSNSEENIFNIKNKFAKQKINLRVPKKVNLYYKSNSFYLYK